MYQRRLVYADSTAVIHRGLPPGISVAERPSYVGQSLRDWHCGLRGEHTESASHAINLKDSQRFAVPCFSF